MRTVLASAALLLAGCGQSGASAAQAGERDGVEPLPFHEQITGGAAPTDELPLIVTLHGRGSDPARFTRFFEDLEAPARLIHLEAPVDEGDGRAWFSFRGKTRSTLEEETRLLAERAVATTEHIRATRPTRGQPVVTGFSQGAMIVYLIALEHPEVFAEAFPVAGVLVSDYGLRADTSLAHLPPIIALHGEDDPIMSVASERRTIALLSRHGARAELRTYPNVVHWIQRGLQDDLHAELTRATRGDAIRGEAQHD